MVRAQTAPDSAAVTPAPPATPASPALAKSGVITGRVLDQEDHQPLPNARVGIYRLAPGEADWTLVAGALSAADGGFTFTVPPGTYRLIIAYQTYTTTVLDDVPLKAGETKEFETTLTPKPLAIKGVEIKGTEARGSEATSLSKQKKASYVSDAITSEQIAKSTDSNAAEALQRVTGLSVVEGKYVFVRGLGERYSSTQVNGSTIGTPEPNKRVVPLDIFPSGALENVVIQKSYTPDQEAEFGGGVVQLNTKDFAESRSFSQSVSMGLTENGLRRGFMSYPGGRYDFLGFDDGTRDMPGLLKELAGNKRITQKSAFSNDGLDQSQIDALGRSFDKVWSPRSKGVPPNYAYAASYSRPLKLLGRDAGFLASFSLSNTFKNETGVQNSYTGTRTSLSPLYLYDVNKSDASVLGGALGNLSVKLAPGHSLHLRTLYTRSTDDEARVAQGPNFNFGSPGFRVTRLGYVERGLLSNVLSAEHLFPSLGNLVGDWSFGYSEARRAEPNRRENTYEQKAEGVYALSQRNQFGLTRIFGDMTEFDRSARGNLTLPFHAWSTQESKLRAGVGWRLRNRTSSYRRFGFSLGFQGSRNLDTTLPPEELLVDDNIKPGYFTLQETTRENDTYRARQEIRSGYTMLDMPVLGHGRVVAGARVEHSAQTVEAESPFVTTIAETDVALDNWALLPALNLSYAVTERMNVRLSGSETISRPELREMSPFDMYDYETGFTEVGNPKINSTPVRNYDVRWEFFPGTRELLAVSGFHKEIKRPIESFVQGSSGGYILSPKNGQDGRLTGAEVEARLGASTFWNGIGHLLPLGSAPGALDRWAFNVNYSRVSSTVRVQITTDAAGNPVLREGPLGGQSTYALNAGLYYGDKTYDGSLLLSAFGRRLAQVGAGQYPSSLPDIYEYPLKSLDFAAGRKLGASLRIKVTAENLANAETRFLQLEKITRVSRPGRSGSLSLSWSL